MKSIFESVIRRGGYDLSGLLNRIDAYHIAGKLTDEERDSLYAMARQSAAPTVDITAKLTELESRIRALEGTEEAPENYTPGKWYYRGDRVLYMGSTYLCIAPEGQVCTWSPAEYPAYWEETV